MMMKRSTGPDIHELTGQEIARQVAALSLRRQQIVSERASMYANALKSGGATDSAPIDDDERAAREHAKVLLNGAAPAALSLFQPAITLDKRLYREQRGIDLALKILADKDLVARAAEAVEWGEVHGPEWRQLAREITLTAIRLDALERRARQLLEGCGDISAVRLPVVMIANTRSIAELSVRDLATAAEADGVVSNAEIRKASHVE
jgi:hypothetical protein